MLSQYAEPEYALALLEHGSAGRAYLLRNASPTSTSCCRAIREVADGGSVIDPRIVEGLVTARSRRRDSPLERLTPREHEVLAEMAQGREQRRASRAALGLSERAVEKHINSLFSKLALSEETDGPPPGQGGARLPLRPRRMTVEAGPGRRRGLASPSAS